MSRFDIPEGSHNLLVGGRQCLFFTDPSKCTHEQNRVCPQCTELTDDEAEAIRQYLTSLTDHYMLPGSHERAGGAECRCGWGWDRWTDQCLSKTAHRCGRCNAPTNREMNGAYVCVQCAEPGPR